MSFTNSELTIDDLRARIKLPELHKLRQICDGLVVHRVHGINVMVEVIEPETKFSKVKKTGSIVFPEGVEEKYAPMPSFGVIVAMGGKVPKFPADEDGFEVGSVVYFSKHSGQVARFDGMTKVKTEINARGEEIEVKSVREFRLLTCHEIFCTLGVDQGEIGGIISVDEPQPHAPDIPVLSGKAIIG